MSTSFPYLFPDYKDHKKIQLWNLAGKHFLKAKSEISRNWHLIEDQHYFIFILIFNPFCYRPVKLHYSVRLYTSRLAKLNHCVVDYPLQSKVILVYSHIRELQATWFSTEIKVEHNQCWVDNAKHPQISQII